MKKWCLVGKEKEIIICKKKPVKDTGMYKGDWLANNIIYDGDWYKLKRCEVTICK